ncbi:MAG: hypothetical protein ACKVS9_18930 [Phycisphaerae bacterium]
MKRIEFLSRLDSDGNLDLHVPIGRDDANAEVRVIITSEADVPPHRRSQEEWKKFIRSIAGTWEGPEFTRPPQGKVEERDSWD